MSPPSERSRSGLLPLALATLALVIATPLLSTSSTAEIPHENYDLVGSDIDLVIAMLNTSIRASEESLRALYEQDVEAAQTQINAAASLVDPAAAIIDEIEDVAASHDHLSLLIPPFSVLNDEMQYFLELEGRMLEIKNEIIAIATETEISDPDAIAVIDSIREINSVLSDMNGTIDDMLVWAERINSLTVADAHPFVPNELIELIERLRDLTTSMHEDIAELIEEGIPWQDDRLVLLLWVEDSELFLGETLRGGGYLLENGTFISGNDVNITINGFAVTTAVTNEEGAFSFSFMIPLNTSWVGSHEVYATARVSATAVTSDILLITVSFVPTKMVLRVSNSTISPSESLIVEALLLCESDEPLPGFECVLNVDGNESEFLTDEDGSSRWTYDGMDLGMGTHAFRAVFLGVLPYAPCESGEMMVTVDVPTYLTLNLFSDRLRASYSLVGDGTLMADASPPLAEQRITLSIDGVVVMNVSTNADGKFAFSIDIADIAAGTHTLTARFTAPDLYWRGSEDSKRFSIITPTYSDYPFFPWIPGWDVGGGFGEQIPYLFFGEYAYFTWLFIILVIGMVIKTLQVRKRRPLMEVSAEGVLAEGEAPSALVPWRKATRPRDQIPVWYVSPNEKIIWYYHNLVAYLKADSRIGIRDNMTHWEVATLMESLGYPVGDVSRIALLYEKAQYSGSDSSEDEVRQMNSSSDSIRSSGGVRPAV
ncbi:MAG: hypothetical protein JSV94_04330 [Methanobacteriota archaeon]|nr:MAG: hypothetical protein JSV94_04330 [Euryarchaeota archaeon]